VQVIADNKMSPEQFLDWVNSDGSHLEQVEASHHATVRKVLNDVAAFNRTKRHPAGAGKALFDVVVLNLGAGLRTFQVVPEFDKKAIFGRVVRLRPASTGSGAWPYLHLVDILTSQEGAGFRRIAKCQECGKFFVSYQTARLGKFCRSLKGQRSECFLTWSRRTSAKRVEKFRKSLKKQEQRLQKGGK